MFINFPLEALAEFSIEKSEQRQVSTIRCGALLFQQRRRNSIGNFRRTRERRDGLREADLRGETACGPRQPVRRNQIRGHRRVRRRRRPRTSGSRTFNCVEVTHRAIRDNSHTTERLQNMRVNFADKGAEPGLESTSWMTTMRGAGHCENFLPPIRPIVRYTAAFHGRVGSSDTRRDRITTIAGDLRRCNGRWNRETGVG